MVERMQSGISLNASEREALKTIAEAIPHMSEFQRGYFQGVAETVREQTKKAREQKTEDPAEEQPA